MKHLFNDLMTSKLPHATALQQRKGVGAFLHWVGGGSEKWYKSPCAEHVRSIAKAAATPLADAWNSKKGRFRSMFMHARRIDWGHERVTSTGPMGKQEKGTRK